MAGTRWFKSGDLADYDAANEVYRIVGRLKELIITGGFNVYPLEVENELNRCSGVLASAVVGVPDQARGELPVAFVEVSEAVDAESLRAALGERLASFKIPRTIHVIAALPRNALGKVEKHRFAICSRKRETFRCGRGTIAPWDLSDFSPASGARYPK